MSCYIVKLNGVKNFCVMINIKINVID